MKDIFNEDEYSQLSVHPNFSSQPPAGMFGICVTFPFGDGWFGSIGGSGGIGRNGGPFSSVITSAVGGCIAFNF